MSGRRLFGVWGSGVTGYVGQVQSIAPSGLISHWSFGEESPGIGTDVFDQVGSNDGVIGSGNDPETIARVESDVTGSDWALEFQGNASDAYVEFSGSSDFDLAADEDLCVNAWIRVLDDFNLSPLVLRYGNTGAGDFWSFHVVSDSGTQFIVNTDLDQVTASSAISPPSIVENELHMVTAVLDRGGGEQVIYIDGDKKTPQTPGDSNGVISLASNSAWIHAHDDDGSETKTQYHEMTFWRGVGVALTQSQIDDLYAAGTA